MGFNGIFMGFPIIHQPFWSTPMYGNLHISFRKSHISADSDSTFARGFHPYPAEAGKNKPQRWRWSEARGSLVASGGSNCPKVEVLSESNMVCCKHVPIHSHFSHIYSISIYIYIYIHDCVIPTFWD